MKNLFVWTLATAITFAIGWIAVAFIKWDFPIPLSGWVSRSYLVACGLTIWLLMQKDGYKKS